MKRVVWFSRNQPLPAQVNDLKTHFGQDMVLIRDVETYDDADDIIARYKSCNADDIVVVAPLSVIKALIERGLMPLQAVVQRIPEPRNTDRDRQFSSKGRHYYFTHFERVCGLHWDVHPLEEEQCIGA